MVQMLFKYSTTNHIASKMQEFKHGTPDYEQKTTISGFFCLSFGPKIICHITE